MSPTLFKQNRHFISLLLGENGKEKGNQWRLSQKLCKNAVDSIKMYLHSRVSLRSGAPRPMHFTSTQPRIIQWQEEKRHNKVNLYSQIFPPRSLFHIYTSNLSNLIQKMYSGRTLKNNGERFPEKKNKVRKNIKRKSRKSRQ